MKTDRNLLKFLAGEAVAQSIVGGGISEASVKMHSIADGLKIEIKTPSLELDNYDIELKNQFLQVYTFYGKSLLPNQDNQAVRVPVIMKAIMLPPVVDATQIDAVFEDGILHIFLPFKNKEELAARKIDIKQM